MPETGDSRAEPYGPRLGLLMRIRSIKPEFWRSDDIAALSIEDRLLFIGLWSYVDDNGVGRDQLADICADLFSRDWLADPRDTVARVSRGLQHLETASLITRYNVDGRPFLHVATWEQHQRVDRPNRPRYPAPDQGIATLSRHPREDASSPRDTLDAGTEEQGNRGTGEQGNRGEGGAGGNDAVAPVQVSPGKPPRKRGSRIPEPFLVTTLMRQWATDEVPTVDVDAATRAFVDYWRAESGSRATKVDWVAAWRNWLRRDQSPARIITARESSLDRVARQHAETAAQLRGDVNHDTERSTRPALDIGNLRPA